MKTVLVTGGTRGIGAQIALSLKEKGYRVLATFKSGAENAHKFEQETGIQTFQWDVSSIEDSQKMGHMILEDFGFVSHIIHNAGITQDAFFHKMTYEQWTSVIQTNLMSCYHVVHPFITLMREKQFGRIIALSSINGVKGQMGQTNYCAAKAGLIGFIKALALENANKNITANVIAPGYIETEMTQTIASSIKEKIQNQIPVGRFGHADEIARAVLFLCDQDAAFITGETLHINGGQYMC